MKWKGLNVENPDALRSITYDELYRSDGRVNVFPSSNTRTCDFFGREIFLVAGLLALRGQHNFGNGDIPMKRHPRTLGVVPITHYPTLVFSSESETEGTLHPGDYALLYPHWYQVTKQSSLQLVGKTAIPARLAPLTNVGGWKRDLEAVLKGPLDHRLEARQADLPYVVFLDPGRMVWQEETPASFPPDASVYLEPWFYTTDTLGRLHALGAFDVQGTPSLDDISSLEERIDCLKELIGIDEQTTIILLEGASEQKSRPRKARLN